MSEPISGTEAATVALTGVSLYGLLTGADYGVLTRLIVVIGRLMAGQFLSIYSLPAVQALGEGALLMEGRGCIRWQVQATVVPGFG